MLFRARYKNANRIATVRHTVGSAYASISSKNRTGPICKRKKQRPKCRRTPEKREREQAERDEAERDEASVWKPNEFGNCTKKHVIYRKFGRAGETERYKNTIKTWRPPLLAALPAGESLYGGFMNSCPFKVNVSFCNFHPVKDSSSAAFDCNNRTAWNQFGTRKCS